MTEEEIRIIANKVAGLLKEQATSVDDLPKVETLAGVYSLPALQEGRVVEVMLELLRGVDGKNAKVYVSESGIMGQMGDDEPILLISNETIKEYAEETVATQAKEAADEATQQIADTEEARANAENLRASNEEERTAAELTRTEAEELRVNAETERVSNETARITKEKKRVKDEQSRVSAENLRSEKEQERIAAEAIRSSSEETRTEAEELRVNAETEREQVKVDMNAAKDAANTATQNANSKAEAAENAATRANAAAEAAEGIVAGIVTKEAIENALTGEINSHTHKKATQEEAGFLSAEDKKKLDKLEQEVAWSDILNKPESFNPLAHAHTASEITDFKNKVLEYSPATDLSPYETAAQAGNKYAAKQHTHTTEDITDMLQSLANNLASANAHTDEKIQEVVGAAPETLNSIQELANAIGDDPNFSVTVANMVAEKLDKSVFELFKQSATSKITNLESHFTNDKRTITEEEATQISKIANIEAQLSGLDSALNNLNNL